MRGREAGFTSAAALPFSHPRRACNELQSTLISMRTARTSSLASGRSIEVKMDLWQMVEGGVSGWFGKREFVAALAPRLARSLTSPFIQRTAMLAMATASSVGLLGINVTLSRCSDGS